MKIDQKKAAVLISYFNIVITNILNIFYVPLMLRILGNHEYGVYSLAISLIEYLAVFNLGYGVAYIKYHAVYLANRDYDAIEKLNGMMITIYAVLSLLFLIVGVIIIRNVQWIIGDQFSSDDVLLMDRLLIVLLISLIVTLPNGVFAAMISANERFVVIRLGDLLRNVGTPVFSIIMLVEGRRSYGMALASLGCTLLVFLYNMLYCIKVLNIRFRFKGWDYSALKDILFYSLFLLMQSITDSVNWQVDNLILARVAGSIGVTYYNLGSRINGIVKNICGAITPVFIPKVHMLIALEKDDIKLSHLFAKVGKIQYAIMLYLYSAFFIWGKDVIKIWIGSGYDESFYVALLLLFPECIYFSQMLATEILRAKNKNAFLNVFFLLLCLSNVIISVPMAKELGAKGAALGTCISGLIGWILVANLYYYYAADIKVGFYFKNIIKVTAITFPIIVLSLVLDRVIAKNIDMSFVWIMVEGIVFSVLYGGIVWIFGLSEAERKEIISRRK